MGISPQTRKILWGLSGARCAFPSCYLELIQPTTNPQNQVIGEEAHIIANKEDGPRGRYNFDRTRINSYENLILLCPNHHTEIDSNPKDYTVEKLYEIKREHEFKIHKNLSSFGFHYVPESTYAHLMEDYKILHIWKYPKIHVVGCSFGSYPVQIGHDSWKGNGLHFINCDPINHLIVKTIVSISEAEFEVEYRCTEDYLEITYFTFDVRVKSPVPFVTVQYPHDESINTKSLYIRLSPDLTASAEPIIEKLKNKNYSNNSIAEDLQLLRNIWISNPKEGIQIIPQFYGCKWRDGENATLLKEIEEELRLITDVMVI